MTILPSFTDNAEIMTPKCEADQTEQLKVELTAPPCSGLSWQLYWNWQL